MSGEYDLFVNGSYMSRLAPRATAQRLPLLLPDAVRRRPHAVAAHRSSGRSGGTCAARAGGLTFGTGWFPPEGGRRRQWIWTSGDAVLAVPPGRDRTLRFELGGPGLPEPVDADRSPTSTATCSASTRSTPDFRVHRLRLPRRGARHRAALLVADVRAGAHRRRRQRPPHARRRGVAHAHGGRDVRPARGARPPLPVAAARPERPVVPVGLRRRHGQQRVHPRLGARAVGHRGGGAVPADLHAQRCTRRRVREPVVLSVGRFFSPGLGHAKRQLEMVEWFGRALRSGALPAGWRMHVVGGCEESQRPYLAQVRGGRRRPAGRRSCPNAPARRRRRPAVDRVGVLVGHRLRRGRAEEPLGQRALRHDDGRGDGRRLRAGRHRPGRPEGDRARGRRRLPLVDAGASSSSAPRRLARDEALRARLAATAPRARRRTSTRTPSPTAGTRSPTRHDLLR